jgi:hypothetical protein
MAFHRLTHLINCKGQSGTLGLSRLRLVFLINSGQGEIKRCAGFGINFPGDGANVNIGKTVDNVLGKPVYQPGGQKTQRRLQNCAFSNRSLHAVQQKCGVGNG